MIKILFSILFLIFIIEIKAQEINNNAPSLTCSDTIKKHSLQWANVGIGLSFPTAANSIEGMELGLNYQWLIKKATIQANARHTGEFLSSSTTLNVLNAGVGKTFQNRYIHISFIAGPGIMWGKFYKDDNPDTKFINPGLSLDSQIIIKPGKNFGIGCELFAHLNKTFNSTGVKFILHLNNKK